MHSLKVIVGGDQNQVVLKCYCGDPDEFTLYDRAGNEVLFADLGSAINYTCITENDAAAMVSIEQIHGLELGFAAGIVDRL